MRSLVIAALACVLAQPAFAQLAPPNAAGITYGHVHLNTADPEVMEKLWVEQFGAVLSTKGTLTVAKLPGMMVAFRKAEPTGTNEGTAMDHFNRGLEKSIGAFDITHNAKFSAIYELPFGRGRQWLQNGIAAHVLGGWRVSGVGFCPPTNPVTFGVDLIMCQTFSLTSPFSSVSISTST